ncbi:SGNH/GDSL hydrolase family protein [Gordonia sp. NPDC003422]
MSRHRWSHAAVIVASVIAAAAVMIPGSAVMPEPSYPVRSTASGSDTPVLSVFALSKYVALGSSYAAGPEVRGLRTVCQRSADNYPHQVADATDMRLTDVSCSGSRTSNILRVPQRSLREPQIAAVTPDTRLVTITTGGNDLDYMSRLLALSCANVDIARIHPLTAKSCTRPHSVRSDPTPQAYVAVERAIVETVAAVRARAPRAVVVLVDYVPVLGRDDRTCPGLPLTPAQVASTRQVYDAMTAATARAAAASGTILVRASKAGVDHGVCSKTPWVNGFGQGGVSYHPNARGKAAVADLVLATLSQPSTVTDFLARGVVVSAPVTSRSPLPSR